MEKDFKVNIALGIVKELQADKFMSDLLLDRVNGEANAQDVKWAKIESL